MTVKLINADCSEILPGEYRGKIDLILTSPPYDSLRDYSGNEFNFEKTAQALVPCLKEGGVMVWVVGDQIVNKGETLTSFRQAIRFQELGLLMHQTLIYNSSSEKHGSNRYARNINYMFVLSKGQPNTVNLIKDKKNSNGGDTRFRKAPGRSAEGEIPKDGQQTFIVNEFGVRNSVWRYGAGYGQDTPKHEMDIIREHPAIFPLRLAIDHIKSWTNEGDLVLDPMCGSGTTIRASKELKRNCIGIEIYDKYCDIIRRRVCITS